MNKKSFLVLGIAVVVIFGIVMIAGKGKSPAVAVEESASPESAALYQQAIDLKKDDNPVAAKQAYRTILENYPESPNINTVQQELYDLNMDIILSKRLVEGKTLIHEVVVGDTLGKIAKKYGATVGLIKKSNGLKNDVIRVGQKLRIWQGSFNLFVDKSQNSLILKDGNEVVKVYACATGKDNITPVGTFTIETKLVDPVWFQPGAVIPPESPQNALGARWMGFKEDPSYGVHGTNQPESIGSQSTEGCVRMHNEDVIELYDLLPRGTKVTIVD